MRIQRRVTGMRDRDLPKRTFLRTRDASLARRYTIFVVDKANDLREIRRILKNAGFRTSAFSSADAAFRKALTAPPSMFILETALPKGDGLSPCHRIRRTSALSSIPVLFLSHRRQEADTIAGFDAGADDYITKPFRERELIARVTAGLRRSYELSRPAQFRFGNVEINSDTISVTVNRTPVDISLSEFRLLEYFIRNPGRTFGRDHLLRMVRASSKKVNPRIVDVYVKRIRKKIEADENHPSYLRTVRGLGYCFHLPERPGTNFSR